MSSTLIAVVVARLLVTGGVVAMLVFCDDYAARVEMGAGFMLLVLPLSIVLTSRVTQKIGFDSGYIRAEADMIREHCRLQDD